MTTAAPRRASWQEGSALISAVVLLVFIGVVGIILLRSTRLDVESSLAQVREKEAFYLAQSGLETARDQLRSNRTQAAAAIATAAGPNGTIDFSVGAVRVIHDRSGRPIGFGGFGDDIPLRPFTALADGAYAAFVTSDDRSGRVLVTGVGAVGAPSLAVVQAALDAAPEH